MRLYEERSKVLIILIVGIGFIFSARLFYLQVLDKDYRQFAENNALRKQVIFPARGIVYDRKGKILVRNETIYDLMVTPSKVTQLDTDMLCHLLEVDRVDFVTNFKKAKQYSKYKASPVVRQITPKQYGRLQDRMFAFRGFYVQPRTARYYPDSIAPHVLGYLGEVNTDDITNGDDYYRMGDFIGKSGLEKSYEQVLRGQKGIRLVLVDVLNREQGSYLQGQYDIPSIAGKDLNTGVDLDLQKYAEFLMKGKKGAIVAIDPSSGEILAMLSAPYFNPNLLLGRDLYKNYPKLLLDHQKPMFNRALSAPYPPGSTIKPVEALIAMHENVITPATTFTCYGGYHLSARHTIGCHASGTFDVHNSIRLSCNTYYCNVFVKLIDQPRFENHADRGLEDWDKGLALFGMGVKTGIDVPNEIKGQVPTPKYFNHYYGEGGWKSSTIISLGIGQAEIGVTPLQMANEAATIANKGYYIQPHLVRSVSDKTTSETLKWEKHNTGIDTALMSVVINAMYDVVERGTGTMARTKGIEICGKTGTAQNPHGKDHSLFIGFAPRKNPKIAIAVVVENAGYGGTWAAPIAGLLIEKYLVDSISRPYIEKHVLDARYLNVPVDTNKTRPKSEKPNGDAKTED